MTHLAAKADQSATTSYRWYVLAGLTLAQTCHGIDRAIIGLVLRPLGQEYDLSGAQLGLLAGVAYGIPFALAAIPFGYAVDRFNRKVLMSAALAAWSGATVLCGAATGFWSMLAGRAAVGVAEAGGSPTGMSLLSDYFGSDRRSTAIGIWYLSSGIGTALAFFAGGWIVAEYGWRWAFIVAGVPGLLLAPFLFFTVREPKRGQQDAAVGHSDAPLSQRLRLLLASAIPLLTAISGVLAVSAGDVSLAVGLLMVAGLLSASYNGPVYAVIVTIAGPQLRGLAVSGVQMSANLIGVGLGAWLIGKVSDVVGGSDGVAWGIGTAMLFCIAGAVLLLMASRQIKKYQPVRS